MTQLFSTRFCPCFGAAPAPSVSPSGSAISAVTIGPHVPESLPSSQRPSAEVIFDRVPTIRGRIIPEPERGIVGGFAHPTSASPSMPESIVSPFVSRALGLVDPVPARRVVRSIERPHGGQTSRTSWPDERSSSVREARLRALRSMRGVYALVRLHGQRGPGMSIALRAIDEAQLAIKATMPRNADSESSESDRDAERAGSEDSITLGARP